MLLWLSIFILFVIILLIAADIFVSTTVRISHRLRLSPLVIGTTIVAIGTSLPELAVSGVATFRGDNGLAIGNIIGSNITNIFFILAVGILIGSIRIGTTKTQKNTLILLIASMLFFIVGRILPYPITGILMVGLAVFFTYEEYRWGVEGRLHEDHARLLKRHIEQPMNFIFWIKFTASLLGIIAGGIAVVFASERISRLSGLSMTILGLSLTALATSLPELFTTIVSSIKKEDKMVIGNILGSNIYNLLFIGGLVDITAGSYVITAKEWFIFIVSSLFLLIVVTCWRGKVVPKWAGCILLIFYILYLYMINLS